MYLVTLLFWLPLFLARFIAGILDFSACLGSIFMLGVPAHSAFFGQATPGIGGAASLPRGEGDLLDLASFISASLPSFVHCAWQSTAIVLTCVRSPVCGCHLGIPSEHALGDPTLLVPVPTAAPHRYWVSAVGQVSGVDLDQRSRLEPLDFSSGYIVRVLCMSVNVSVMYVVTWRVRGAPAAAHPAPVAQVHALLVTGGVSNVDWLAFSGKHGVGVSNYATSKPAKRALPASAHGKPHRRTCRFAGSTAFGLMFMNIVNYAKVGFDVDCWPGPWSEPVAYTCVNACVLCVWRRRS